MDAHWSLALTVLIELLWFVGRLFPVRYPELGGRAIVLMAVASVLLYVGSILLHELGHVTQGIREGAAASHITLWFFGGVAYGIQRASPGVDARVYAAGPAVSVVLAVAFGLLAWLSEAAGVGDAVTGVLVALSQLNAVLLALNMLPMFPLDGGGLLRAWLWHRRRDRVDATLSAARVGQVVAGVTILFGALAPFAGILPGAYEPDAVISGLGVMGFGALGLYLSLRAEDEIEAR